MSEELLLQLFARSAIERREMCIAMHRKPFLGRRRSEVTFKISAWVTAHSAPVGSGEKWDNHFRRLQRALAVIGAIERPLQFLVVRYGAALRQNFRRQGLRSGYELSSS